MLAVANLGVRAPDIDAEIWFLQALGARSLLQSGPDRWHMMLGDTRLVLFRRAPYDARLEAAGLRPGGGISHVAFELDGAAPLADPLVPTFDANVPALPDVAGSRRGPVRVTFYVSPNGAVLETQEFRTGGVS